MRRALPLILIGLGIILVSVVAVPLVASQMQFWLNRPVVLIDPSVNPGPQAPFVSTQASEWFTNAPKLIPIAAKVSFYTLSIPKIGLTDVKVEINGDDLKKSAVQYPGTALPGTFGNTVIFGHSTSPFLYKIGDPLSIFNPLLKTKVGDEIVVYFDGVTYRYIVRNIAELDPDKIEVLAQRYDKYELTLVTCTPLGTYLRRFVVRAELVN